MELFERLRREYEFGIGTVKGVARTVRRSSPDGAPGGGERPAAAAWLSPARQAGLGTGGGVHRCHSRGRCDGASQAASHGTADPPADPGRAAGVAGRGIDGPQPCPRAAAGAGHGGSRRPSCRNPTPGARRLRSTGTRLTAELGGDRVKLQVFCMRSMASGAAFHRAYPRATQQAFLEAHEHAFAYFGGVHRVLRYDNLTSAVRKILRGHRREETVRFVAFRSHWRFEAQFCTPAAGHEKGGVEGEVGYFRRNHWVPVPSAADLDELNGVLLAGCRGRRAAADRRSRAVCRRGSGDRAGPSAAGRRGGLRPGRGVVPAGQCERLHHRARQRLLGTAAAGQQGAGQPATRPISRSGTAVLVSPGMSAVTAGVSRFSTSITISTCSSASRVRWPAPSRSSSGAAAGAGRPTMTRCGGG